MSAREDAQRVLDEAEDPAGALRGIGYALLAACDQLALIATAQAERDAGAENLGAAIRRRPRR